MVTGDSQEEVIIFCYKQTELHHNIYHHHHNHIIKPVQFVEVEDGQENTEQVDENPDRVQHIVTVRSLRPRFRSYFLMSIIIKEREKYVERFKEII